VSDVSVDLKTKTLFFVLFDHDLVLDSVLKLHMLKQGEYLAWVPNKTDKERGMSPDEGVPQARTMAGAPARGLARLSALVRSLAGRPNKELRLFS
jgi:hypothetical protein